LQVPGMGPLPWAGIAGMQSVLRHCRRWNDLGHPFMEARSTLAALVATPYLTNH
jgi:hypothetical protein